MGLFDFIFIFGQKFPVAFERKQSLQNLGLTTHHCYLQADEKNTAERTQGKTILTCHSLNVSGKEGKSFVR